MISYDPNRMGPWSDFSPPVPRLLTLYVMVAAMNDMIKLLNEMID